ncbi:amino acid ABC transporter ATP-binding protein [Branchiibius sp. NY16-3462-2]|uniref:amino acid ABC transporter ATP-binding protein n=1 Tax=Branchiibius sp. NY16-3462-2 TaxID=1807500 RepID=UPI000792D5FC|nr:amino acid ABC transporter ATP-binding protein [Branchiibius sp. NY16-3462-2]KYH42938.1 ectoine/hydroxyectoine ABC transporter ATP-binding protein EhuA [Branchiibius sp. NY16-3462-2]
MTATATTGRLREVGDPLLRIRGLHKAFGLQTVLEDIDLDVHTGDVTVLIGRSGSGKSTLLRCINHLEKPDGGYVEIDGQIIGYREHRGRLVERHQREITRQRADLGMVFQQFNLFGHLTVLENLIEAPVSVRGVSRTDASRTASDLLARVGLAGRENSYPSQLSGGQQQRVAIARALAMRPRLLLFDEPTSALDPELVGEVLAVIRDLAADGMTMTIVTHEIAFAREVADTVVFLDGGHIVEKGSPAEVLDDPQDSRTQAFLSAVL